MHIPYKYFTCKLDLLYKVSLPKKDLLYNVSYPYSMLNFLKNNFFNKKKRNLYPYMYHTHTCITYPNFIANVTGENGLVRSDFVRPKSVLQK